MISFSKCLIQFVPHSPCFTWIAGKPSSACLNKATEIGLLAETNQTEIILPEGFILFNLRIRIYYA